MGIFLTFGAGKTQPCKQRKKKLGQLIFILLNIIILTFSFNLRFPTSVYVSNLIEGQK